ncbi:hypothetical protein P3L10_032542 [Capsicum annuum]
MEKVVGDMFSNSAKQIGSIMKKVNDQAPERYFLKPEVDAKRFLKPAPESEKYIFFQAICYFIFVSSI